jgi:hypothetical protein
MSHKLKMKELLKIHTENAAKLGRVESIKYTENKSSIVKFKKISIPEKLGKEGENSFITESNVGDNDKTFYFLFEDIYVLTVRFIKTGEGDNGVAELSVDLMGNNREHNITAIHLSRILFTKEAEEELVS